MCRLGQCYVQAFNHRHRRSGPLWQGRFKSCLVDSDKYLLAVYRYIDLNLVRTSLVASPEHYRWSSVHANLGIHHDHLVTPHPRFLALDSNADVRARIYKAWLQQRLDPGDMDAICKHLQQERALGDPKFQATVEKALGRQARVRSCGRPCRLTEDSPEVETCASGSFLAAIA